MLFSSFFLSCSPLHFWHPVLSWASVADTHWLHAVWHGFGVKPFEFKFWLSHCLNAWPGVNYLMSLELQFLHPSYWNTNTYCADFFLGWKKILFVKFLVLRNSNNCLEEDNTNEVKIATFWKLGIWGTIWFGFLSLTDHGRIFFSWLCTFHKNNNAPLPK